MFIPHNCEECGDLLKVDDYKYWKGKYYCTDHVPWKRKK